MPRVPSGITEDGVGEVGGVRLQLWPFPATWPWSSLSLTERPAPPRGGQVCKKLPFGSAPAQGKAGQRPLLLRHLLSAALPSPSPPLRLRSVTFSDSRRRGKVTVSWGQPCQGPRRAFVYKTLCLHLARRGRVWRSAPVLTPVGPRWPLPRWRDVLLKRSRSQGRPGGSVG